MVIRDCNKDDKWSWMYLQAVKHAQNIHFDGMVGNFDKNIINFVKR